MTEEREHSLKRLVSAVVSAFIVVVPIYFLGMKVIGEHYGEEWARPAVLLFLGVLAPGMVLFVTWLHRKERDRDG